MNSAPLHRLALALRARPVALLPSAFETIDRQLSDAIAARVADIPSKASAPSAPGATPAHPYAMLVPGVAVVRLHGVCGRHLSQLAMDCGGVDVDRVAEAVREANADTAVRAIVLDCDSPGGSVAGVDDCARAVRSSEKPVVALASDLCASAAYWIASQADFLLAGATGEVGSVGVYCAFLDESKAYDKAGLRVEVISSGENKGAGTRGTALTDGQRELLQAQVDELAAIFKGAVSSARPGIDNELLDGRCLIGASAVTAGFADDLGDEQSAIALALQLADIKESAR